MALKVAACLFVSAVLLIGTIDVKADKLKEVVRKSVSVKSRPRDTSVINHFNPAGHVYAAEGNVVINRDTPKPVEVKKAPEVKIAPKSISLAKKVSVHSPVTSLSESKHFDPAAHIYQATGEVKINRESSLLKRQNIFDKRDASFSLSKSVSVKSPQRQSSVINHFNPAGHIYAATGSVFIQNEAKPAASIRSTVSQQPKSKSPSSENQNPRYVYPEPSVTFKDGSQTNSKSTKKPASSELNVQKSVSVKSPQRVSSVINHFTPAGHVYAATGEVNIHRQSQQPSVQKTTKIAPSVIEFIKPKKAKPEVTYAPPTHVEAKPSKPIITYAPPSRATKSSASGLSVKKLVSVKSPERKSSVISHFTPANHKYAATGSVEINRQSSLESPAVEFKPQATTKVVDTKSSPSFKSKPSLQYVAPQVKPQHKSSELSVQKSVSVKSPQRASSVINHFNPAGHVYAATGAVNINRQSHQPSAQKISFVTPPLIVKEKLKPQVTYAYAPPARVESKPTKPAISFAPPKPTSKSVSSGFTIEKSVSVKSPERKSSVISHFTPAGHNYAATGNVVINRQSSLETKVVNDPKQKVTSKIVSTKSTSSLKSQPSHQFVAHKVKAEPKSSELSVQKSVSVKSPQRATSVISHFNPAGHIYAATGAVNIHRQSQQPSVQKTTKIAPSVIEFIKPKITQPKVTYASPTPVKAKLSKPIVTYAPPSRATKSSASGLSVKKLVSVKSPERKSSVISHFTPATHKYAATGSVEINRQSSLESPAVVFKPQATTKVVETKSSPSFKSKPSPQYVAPQVKSQPKSSELNVQKSVSVKSPQRASSVINHFNPAGHVYAATGAVNIHRQSQQPSVQKTTKIAPSVIEFISTKITQPKVTYAPPTPVEAKLSKPIVTYAPPSRATKSSASGLSIKKLVSVKSPERKSSVISHFTPANHKYAATGSVEINRQSSLESPAVEFKPQATTKVVETKSSPSFKSKPSLQYVAPQVNPQHKSSELSVQKSVSVKSPQRASSVINHFNPAGHVYAATGAVNINRQSHQPSAQKISFVTPPLIVKEKLKPQVTYSPPAPLEPKPSKPSVSYKLPSYDNEEERSSSSLSLKKSVSVKSPERKSSVISHFTPAGHKYEATGNVVINRVSSLPIAKSSPKPSEKSVVEKITLEKPIQKPVRFSLPVQSFTIPIPKGVADSKDADSENENDDGSSSSEEEEEEEEDSEPSAANNDFLTKFAGIASYLPPAPAKKPDSDKKPAESTKKSIKADTKPAESFKKPDTRGQLNIKKSVSVHSPKDTSTVISHFNPAKHVYAATGQVSITRSL